MARSSAAMPLTALIHPVEQPAIGTEAVDRMLNALRAHLDMDVAFVAEFRSSDRISRHVDARDFTPVHPGVAVSLDDGYCQRVVDGRLPRLIPDTMAIAAAMALPETTAIPIGAHLSVPIMLADGTVYGTLCCFSFQAQPTLCDRDLRMMQVLAQLLAEQIDADFSRQRDQLEKTGRIAGALAVGQPDIIYQPIYDLASNQLAGLESLARFMIEPHRPPDHWFAEAADVGMLVDLEIAAIESALRALSRIPSHIYVSVNCSPLTILSHELQELLHTVDLGRVVLEVT